jgi:hypothetical protein
MKRAPASSSSCQQAFFETEKALFFAQKPYGTGFLDEESIIIQSKLDKQKNPCYHLTQLNIDERSKCLR